MDKKPIYIYIYIYAQMAEWVDALDSKSSSRNIVRVRIPLWARQSPNPESESGVRIISTNCRNAIVAGTGFEPVTFGL